MSGELTVSNKGNTSSTERRLGINDVMGYESESNLGRFIGHRQFLKAYVGWDFGYRKSGF